MIVSFDLECARRRCRHFMVWLRYRIGQGPGACPRCGSGMWDVIRTKVVG